METGSSGSEWYQNRVGVPLKKSWFMFYFLNQLFHVVDLISRHTTFVVFPNQIRLVLKTLENLNKLIVKIGNFFPI